MTANRIFNFNAGPAALPLPVLEEIQESFLDFAGSGMSIMEVSHRSKWFDEVINDAVERTKRLLGLGASEVDWDYEEGADYVVLADPDGNRFCDVEAGERAAQQ